MIKKITYQEFLDHCREIEQATFVPPGESAVIKKQRIQRARRDYNFFVQHYFPHYVTAKDGGTIDCAAFQVKAANAVKADPNIFAVFEWAREHAKSVHADIMIPLWLKMQGELDGMVIAGKSYDDACAQLSDLQAELVSNARYITDFGEQKVMGSWQDGYFETTDGILFIALGRGQSPRGLRNRQKRPNYCVVDDIDDDELVQNPARVYKVVKWILGALYGALAINGARFIMAGNRIHRESVLACIADRKFEESPEESKYIHFSGEEEDVDDDATPARVYQPDSIFHLRVNAIDDDGKPSWPQKFTLAALRRRMRRMGYALAQREYQNNPINEGKIFKYAWVQWKKAMPLDEYDAHCIYIDPSMKSSATSDFKAVVHWAKKGRELHGIKMFVAQCSIKTMVKWCYDYFEELESRWPNVSVPFFIEGIFAQDRLIEDFEVEGDQRGWQLPITPDYREKPDKFSRIVAMQPYWERGYVYWNEDEKGSTGMARCIEQHTALEPGVRTADDAPDATEGAWFKLNRMTRIQMALPVIGKRTTAGAW